MSWPSSCGVTVSPRTWVPGRSVLTYPTGQLLMHICLPRATMFPENLRWSWLVQQSWSYSFHNMDGWREGRTEGWGLFYNPHNFLLERVGAIWVRCMHYFNLFSDNIEGCTGVIATERLWCFKSKYPVLLKTFYQILLFPLPTPATNLICNAHP